MLLRVYPRAASTPNGLGLTPLHLAARTRNVGVIAVLLQTCPQAVCSASVVGYTPLHLAIRGAALILSGQSSAVPQHEEDARVPQQEQPRESDAPPARTTVVVVRRLIEGNIAVLHVKDRDGETPLRHFCHYMEPIVHKLMVHARDTYHGTEQEIQYLRQHPIIGQCWETFQLLVKAATAHASTVLHDSLSEREMVHDVVKNLDCLESFTFSLLTLKLCRGQLEQRDERGDLPLHILSSVKVRPQRYEFKLPSSSQQQVPTRCRCTDVSMNAMDLFLAFHKPAASMPDRDGELPLHLVLRNNAQWEDAVETLMRVYPAAVTVRDKKSGLYPFMMAAVDESASLTTLFRLIRACPEFSRFVDGAKAQEGCCCANRQEDEVSCLDVLRDFVCGTREETQSKRAAEASLSSSTRHESRSTQKRPRIV